MGPPIRDRPGGKMQLSLGSTCPPKSGRQHRRPLYFVPAGRYVGEMQKGRDWLLRGAAAVTNAAGEMLRLNVSLCALELSTAVTSQETQGTAS